MFCYKFCELTQRNVHVWFKVFTFCFTFRSKFCELTLRNMRVWFNVFYGYLLYHV
ncbi:hypothetical protein Hanom_Chr11g00972551 [Helianthus anomalus]